MSQNKNSQEQEIEQLEQKNEALHKSNIEQADKIVALDKRVESLEKENEELRDALTKAKGLVIKTAEGKDIATVAKNYFEYDKDRKKGWVTSDLQVFDDEEKAKVHAAGKLKVYKVDRNTYAE